MADNKIDDVTGVETTGHEWDGIRELNNPLPRWWVLTFYVTVLWAIGYWIVMPAWPLVSSYTTGVLNHSDRANLAAELAEVKASQAVFAERLAAVSLEEIRTDAELLEFALAGGRSAFAVNCSQCHGSGAAGSVGYPNLNDDDWLWGGDLEAIETTILYGIRSGHDDGRENEMPAFGRDEILEPDQIQDVASYVLSLSGASDDAAAVERGAPIFAEQCASCHGEQGEGIAELGSPNLTDAIWLYGGEREAVVASISNSRNGVMPHWEGRLDDTVIKQLAIYVHSLGGGQ